jgi:hypothetical protein
MEGKGSRSGFHPQLHKPYGDRKQLLLINSFLFLASYFPIPQGREMGVASSLKGTTLGMDRSLGKAVPIRDENTKEENQLFHAFFTT